jgi:hypothetical protein
MTQSDVREAAGRLHRVYAGESYTDVYRDKLRADGMEGSLAVAYSLADEDRHLVADAYLAETDPTLVDEDWAESVGTRHDGSRKDLILFINRDCTPDMVWDTTADEWTLTPGPFVLWRRQTVTRGQVRTAARLFGIELKEKA